MPKKNSTKDNFETKIHKLEEISEQLESEEIGLDEAIKLYEEGIELSKDCLSTLKNAELKVTELKKKLEGLSSSEDELIDE